MLPTNRLGQMPQRIYQRVDVELSESGMRIPLTIRQSHREGLSLPGHIERAEEIVPEREDRAHVFVAVLWEDAVVDLVLRLRPKI